jgi:hypothetical protein
VSILVWFLAVIQLGVAMAVMNWLVFNWLFGAAQLPREAGHNAIREHLMTLRKHPKTNKTKIKTKNSNYLYKRWLFFKGSFYGLAVLWTLRVIGVSELTGLIFNFNMAALLADAMPP